MWSLRFENNFLTVECVCLNKYWYSHLQVQCAASAGPHLLPVPGAIQDLHQSLQHQVIIPNYKIKQKWATDPPIPKPIFVLNWPIFFNNLERDKIAVSLQTGGFWQSLQQLKYVSMKGIVCCVTSLLQNGDIWSDTQFFHETSLLPFTSSLIEIFWPLHHSHGLYWHSNNLYTVIALSWPLLPLSFLRLYYSHTLTFSGSLHTLFCFYTNLKTSTGTHTTSASTLVASTSILLMAFISPFNFYKHYLKTRIHSHGFYNNITASSGTLMTSTVTFTA